MPEKNYERNMFKGEVRFKRQVQNQKQYKQQREFALMRAGYQCEECKKNIGDMGADGKVIKALDMHHIKEMVDIIDENNITTLDQANMCMELFNVDNVQILCKPCHRKTDSYSLHSKKKK